jgi:anti-sigma regulatory factor (Ser/Thr protein kinase)
MSALLLERERAVRHVMRTSHPTALIPRIARTWLTGILANAGHAPDAAVLALDELVTNAVLYAWPPLQVTAQIEDGRTLRLNVQDRVPSTPRASDLPDDEHGLGLGIVHSLCAGYDEDTRGGTHTVEVTIELNGEQQ